MPQFDAAADIIDDNSSVQTALGSDDGLTRHADEQEQHVDMAVAMIVTDHQILFVTVEQGGDDTGALSYEELVAIDVGEQTLELTTTAGVVWEFPLAAPDSEVVATARDHLRWIGDIRSRVKRSQNDVDLAVGKMEAAADQLEWEQALDTYHSARKQLDDLISTVQLTEPLADEILAPELAAIERRLEKEYARLYIRRAQSQLDLGRHLVENGDYEQARKVLEQAQEYYERAKDRSEAIQRGDAFQFGEQRELETELEDLGWEIETVAAEPIRQAHEAKIKAQNATDRRSALTHWENAFRRYGNVLTLEWGDSDRNFAGDPETVQEEMEVAAANLIELHQAAAREEWNEGVRLEQRGQIENALQQCRSGVEHLERAHELAKEFAPELAGNIGTQFEQLVTELGEIRRTLERQQTKDETKAGAGSSQTHRRVDDDDKTERARRDGGDEDWPPSVESLSGIDTHHELTFSVDGVTRTENDRDRQEQAKKRSEHEPSENGTNGGQTTRSE